jgi:hypothetical protein
VPIICALIVAAAAHSSAPSVVAPLRLAHVSVALPSREVVRVTLTAPAPAAKLAAGMSAQRLTLGGVPIPLATPVDVTVAGGETRPVFDVRLADVPEGVLGLDPNRVPLLWEGLDGAGAPVLAVGGTVDFGDPGDVQVPVTDLYHTYATLTDFTVTPGLSAVNVHGLLGLFNPFSFDLVATRIELTVKVGTETVLATKRPGFRLRAGQRSDVLVDQDVPLADAAGGVGAFLRGEAAVLEGTLILRTPQGERAVPLHMRAAMK